VFWGREKQRMILHHFGIVYFYNMKKNKELSFCGGLGRIRTFFHKVECVLATLIHAWHLTISIYNVFIGNTTWISFVADKHSEMSTVVS
jgi:hypothetical protein